MHGGGQAGRDAADALAEVGLPRSGVDDGGGLRHEDGAFVGVASGRLDVAVAAKAGHGLVVAVRAVVAEALRAAGGEGQAGVAAACEQAGGFGFQGICLVFAEADAGVASITARADVVEHGFQSGTAEAVFVKQEVGLPAAVCGVPGLFAVVGGKAAAFAGGAGRAVDAVVRLAVGAEEVGSDVGAGFGVLLPFVQRAVKRVLRQPLAFFEFFAILFVAGLPVARGQGGQGQVAGREGVADDEERSACGVVAQAGGEGVVPVLFGDAPADVAEPGVADERGAEGGLRADGEAVGLHVRYRRVGWRRTR